MSAAVGGLLQPGQVVPQALVRFAQNDFVEVVQFAAAAARETEISEVKQIQLPAKGGLGTPRALGHGGDAAQVRREPLDDEARLGERTGAENEAGGAFVHQEDLRFAICDLRFGFASWERANCFPMLCRI